MSAMMKDLDLTSLRMFVAICDTRRIALVAESEGLVPSAISKRMDKLEAYIGTALLTQLGRGVEPTVAGLALAEQARTLLLDANRIVQDMQSHRAGATEIVRLTSTDSPAAGLLLDDFSDFLSQPAHRAIRFKLLAGKSRTAVVLAIKDGSAHFGVLWDSVDLSDFQTLPYRSDQLAVVTDRNHPLARHRQVMAAETMDFEHILISSGKVVVAMLQRTKALDLSKLSIRGEVDSFESAFRLVSAGNGICVAPVAVATKSAKHLSLAVIPLGDAWASRRYIIAYRDENALTPAARLLVHHLASAAQQVRSAIG